MTRTVCVTVAGLTTQKTPTQLLLLFLAHLKKPNNQFVNLLLDYIKSQLPICSLTTEVWFLSPKLPVSPWGRKLCNLLNSSGIVRSLFPSCIKAFPLFTSMEKQSQEMFNSMLIRTERFLHWVYTPHVQCCKSQTYSGFNREKWELWTSKE